MVKVSFSHEPSSPPPRSLLIFNLVQASPRIHPCFSWCLISWWSFTESRWEIAVPDWPGQVNCLDVLPGWPLHKTFLTSRQKIQEFSSIQKGYCAQKYTQNKFSWPGDGQLICLTLKSLSEIGWRCGVFFLCLVYFLWLF